MKIKNIVLAVIAAVMMMAVPATAADETATVKVVYPLDFANPKRVHFMLNTLNNLVAHYQKNLTDYEISIVAYGPGLQFVMKGCKGTGFSLLPYCTQGGPTGKGTQGRLAALKQLAGDNLRIYACENTMQKKKVKKEQLLPYVELTPGGILKIIELEQEGASYIKIM